MKFGTVLLAGAIWPLGAVAQDFNYTFVELAYAHSEIDAGSFDVDGDGFELNGSVELTDAVFLFGEYSSYGYDGNVDSTSYTLGAGMRWSLRPELDLVGEFGWVHARLDRPLLSDIDDNGFRLGVGVRSRIHDAIEVQAGIRHINLDDSDTFLMLAGRYYFTERVAAGLGFSFNDDDTRWSIGVRAEFGR